VRESRLLDGPAQGIGPDNTVAIARDYEFVVLYTSTAGFASDIRLAERIKAGTPGVKIAFVGPHVTAGAEVSLQASPAIDFVARGEFDYPVAEFAEGRRLEDIAGVTYWRDGRVIHSYTSMDRRYMVEMVERFYDRYYFRPKVIFRILRLLRSRRAPAVVP
jgi:hypothetical protein